MHKLRCFYCNIFLPKKELKNNKEWICPKCQEKNYLDDKGNIIDVPSHIVNAKNHSNIRYTTSSSKSIESSPFCQTCIKNHSFIVNVLASYLPPEDDPDYRVYLFALPSYRAFLEEQYPMVCDLCSSRVQEHLARKNYIAKSNALGGWLLNSKKTCSLKHTQSRLFLWIRLFIWGLRGMGWWTVTFSIILYYILGFFVPDIFLKSASQITPFWNIKDFSQCLLFVRKLILWGIFVILWDYTWVSQISKPNYRVSGKTCYYICQAFIHIIRAGAEFIISERISDALIYSEINLALFFISLTHLILTFKCIYLVPPVSISLYDSNSRQISAELKQRSNTKFQPIKKTFNDKHDENLPHPLFINHELKEQQCDKNLSDDFMQLDPPEPLPLRMDSKNIDTYDNSSFNLPQGMRIPHPPSKIFSCFNTQQSNKSINSQKNNYFSQPKTNLFKIDQKETDNEIAPQRFFAPEQPTGLETIFSPALRLDDEPLIVRALRIVKRRKLNWLEIVSLLWALEIVIINFLNLGIISYYSSFVGSFAVTFSIGSNFFFLKKTSMKLVFIGVILSLFYYLLIYINHHKNLKTFLQSKEFFLWNILITGFYFCYTLRILWTILSFWRFIPLKVKQESSQKYRSKIWGSYAYTK
ncbi:hypothetical protein PCANB_002298 [Pneumocystis canis]|nr:hypothetical protein PCANB_002298 [Pneumocystis canis]